MVCSLALDPRFKHFAVQLCGLSRGEDYVWGVVKDAALRHRKFEKRSDEVPPPALKRPRTGFFDALHEFIEEGPPMSSIADTDSTHELDVAISNHTERCLCLHKTLIRLASGGTIQLLRFFALYCR